MDPRYRRVDQTEMLNTALDGRQAEIWTALPCIVQSFTTEGELTVSVQPAIQAQVQLADPNGTFVWVNLPILIHCPVMFQGGGNFLATFPIAEGDEGLIVFGSRCIDAWWQSGGVQVQAELRMHDLSDGFYFPKCYSKGNTPPNVSRTTAQLRSFDGTAYFELAPGGVGNIVMPGGLNITAAGGITMTAPTVTVAASGGDATLDVTGTVTASVDVVADGTSGHTHKHGGVQIGGSQTTEPV